MPTWTQPALEPHIADVAPSEPRLTVYDQGLLIAYLRLLDAELKKVDWQDAARIVLKVDAAREPARAQRMHDTHLARAKWIQAQGFLDLLKP